MPCIVYISSITNHSFLCTKYVCTEYFYTSTSYWSILHPCFDPCKQRAGTRLTLLLRGRKSKKTEGCETTERQFVPLPVPQFNTSVLCTLHHDLVCNKITLGNPTTYSIGIILVLIIISPPLLPRRSLRPYTPLPHLPSSTIHSPLAAKYSSPS